MSHLALVAFIFAILAGAGDVSQDPVPVVLADEVDTPGVQESVDVSYAEDCRLTVSFDKDEDDNRPFADVSEIRIEGSVDQGESSQDLPGTTTTKPFVGGKLGITDDTVVNFSGPLDQVRVNVKWLGGLPAEGERIGPPDVDVTVTVKGLCTVR